MLHGGLRRQMGTSDVGNGTPFVDQTDPERMVADFLNAVYDEVHRARVLCPDPRCLTVALAEESGEVMKAVMGEPWENVITECIQTAAMACRLACEGDPTMDNYRSKHANRN